MLRYEASLGGYENLGSGAARGIELLVKLQTDEVFGWLAYTGAQLGIRRQFAAVHRRDGPRRGTLGW